MPSFQLPSGQLDDEQINGYLAALASGTKSPSRSSFKHSIYGLRFYFRLVGYPKRAINLPSLKKEEKLPVVFNQQELIRLFNSPDLIRNRALLSLVYAAGLRAGELCRLKIADIDSKRMTTGGQKHFTWNLIAKCFYSALHCISCQKVSLKSGISDYCPLLPGQGCVPFKRKWGHLSKTSVKKRTGSKYAASTFILTPIYAPFVKQAIWLPYLLSLPKGRLLWDYFPGLKVRPYSFFQKTPDGRAWETIAQIIQKQLF